MSDYFNSKVKVERLRRLGAMHQASETLSTEQLFAAILAKQSESPTQERDAAYVLLAATLRPGGEEEA